MLGTGPAAALPYSNLYVFGDSLVDTGNTQHLLLGLSFGTFDVTPASQGYFFGRFTNGPNAADYLNLDIEGSGASGSRLGGDNYAYGGARARVDGDPVPDLAAQVSSFMSNVAGVADPNALYLVNIGGNDARDIVLNNLTGSARQQVIADAVSAISSQVSALQAAGAAHILVTGVADVGRIPEILALGAASSAAGHEAAIDLNAAIDAALPGSVLRLDVIALFETVLANPAAFGLPLAIDTTISCLSANAGPVCTNYAFFDNVHPTAALHQILGSALIAAAAVPEPGTLVLVFVGCAALARARRVRTPSSS
jgi:phospholipase/lecithinase/hemolysin